jgi:hypothetical protein
VTTLENIVREGRQTARIMFREQAYAARDHDALLRDVMALANANVQGQRVIVLGAEARSDGTRLHELPAEILAQGASFQGVVRDFIEPPVSVQFRPFQIEGKQLAAIIVNDCQDRPYMMRADHSAGLRRGDAWIRVDTENQRMGRRHMVSIFSRRFAEPTFKGHIEVGFPGDFILKDLDVPTADLSSLPSNDARQRIQTLIDTKRRTTMAADGTFLARLTHARLFGSEQAYVHHSVEDLEKEMELVNARYQARDDYHRYVEKGFKLELVVFNQGEEAIEDASISLMSPSPEGFAIALAIPKRPAADNTSRKTLLPEEENIYPSVGLFRGAYQVTENIGTLECGKKVQVFKSPLLISAEKTLVGQKVTLYYKLFGRNLRKPLTGNLTLRLKRPAGGW